MCLIFTCGEHTFRKEVEGYEGLTCQCHNCGNYSAHVIKSNPWFTFCFIVGASLSTSVSPLQVLLRSSLLYYVYLYTKPSGRVQLPRPTALLQRLPRCRLPHLQLCPAAREQTRRYEHEGRWQQHTDAKSTSATGLGRRPAATSRPTAHAIQVTQTM
ncbi:hypothetical protein F4859DRAFT_495311 [Xylaria cf. heliscus]|nr:hypothetical protein F4859DRAFT_495311 [Xylaria cf. heliscus]